jgi:PadR family transcriptional regulator PadR
MATAEPRLSHTSAMILQAISAGHIYGYSVMDATGLASGTVYPALRRLEQEQLIRSQWEKQAIADAELRPPRKYFKLTPTGEAILDTSRKRYPLLAKIGPATDREEI